MRKLILYLLSVIPFYIFGQAPNGLSFQAVVRNTEGGVISNQQIQVKLSILKGSNKGPTVYSEIHTPTTNESGLFSLTIGQGVSTTGTFVDIDWSAGDLYLKREIDPNNNSTYPIVGTSQFLTIPYSFYSNVADSVISKQKLSISNDTIYLSGGGNIKIPGINQGDILDGSEEGEILYWNGSSWVALSKGLPGQQLIIDVNGLPKWTGDAYPTVTTVSTSSITATSVTVNVNISADGGQRVSSRGVVYGTSDNPSLSNSSQVGGSGTGSFSVSINGLIPNTTYYVRGFGSNSVGTGYGSSLSFTTTAPTLPILSTNSVSSITQTSAVSGGVISSDGGSTVTSKGVVWSTLPNPTISDSKTTEGTGAGNFSSSLSGLSDNTTYYIRAYATNAVGTAYGNELNFTTSTATVPILTTNGVVNITNTSASSGGAISSDGGSAITAKGIVWSTSSNPTISDNKTIDGTGTASFNSTLTGLSANTTYYVRAYATNSSGTGYGNQKSFTTASTANTIATVILDSVGSIGTITATVYANISNRGAGEVTERGIVWNVNTSPTILNNRIPSGSGEGYFSIEITSGLESNKTYSVKAYAINSFDIAFSNELSFTTLEGLATISTNTVIAYKNSATSGGNITETGGSNITARGIVWSTDINPTILDNKTEDGMGGGYFISNLTGLMPNTTYYLRAYAVNNFGITYGDEKSFITPSENFTINDIDGNIYSAVQIGNQFWMAENLKTTKYRNGTSIPYIIGSQEWSNLTTNGWSYFDNNIANNDLYGKLYNWFTIKGDSICPIGWHVPTNEEILILVNYLGGTNDAGGKLKNFGTNYWVEPNIGATNESGFNALPSGYLTENGIFEGLYNSFVFWSKTEISHQFSLSDARALFIGSGSASVYNWHWDKEAGLSIRCLKD